jgi:FixJ family two-component response regulator
VQLEAVIAILDDDEVSSTLLVGALESGGLAAKFFSTPAAFLDYMQGHRPRCVLLDMNMPGMNGVEVQCALRAMGSTTPVIMISGESDVTTANAALLNGASNFISKPIDAADVLRRIREATSPADSNAA